MRKKVLCLALVSVLGLGVLTGGGNRTLLDTTYTYNRAMIKLQDGTVVDGQIRSWRDYDGEQLQVIMKSGEVYLTNSINCTLIKE